jgi:adenylate cyclase
MKLTFRVTFTVIILSLIVATVAGVGTISYLNARFIARDLSSQVLRQASSRIAQRIESLLGTAASITEVNRNLFQSEQLSVTDFEAATAYFLQVIKVHRNLTFLSLSLEGTGEYCDVWRKHKTGQIVIREYRRNDRGTVDRCEYMEHGKGRKLTTCVTESKYDPRKRPFYRSARKAGRLVWPEAYVFHLEDTMGIPGITCATPLYATGRSLLGVLTADFDVNALCKYLKAIRIGRTGFAFVVEIRADGTRRVIAHPNPEILTRVVKGKSVRDLVPAEDVEDPLVRAFVRHLPGKASLDNLRGVKQFEFNAAGRRYLAGYRKVGGKNSPRWLIGMVVPESEVMGRVERNNMMTLAIGAASFLLTLLVGIWISARVSKPLARIAQESEAIGRFELDAKPIGRSVVNEVDRLMVATEDMKTSLRSFKKFVPADLVREILASGQEARLGARRATLTVFFSDIVGFTPIAERLPPDELVEHMGDYFEEMSRRSAALSSGLSATASVHSGARRPRTRTTRWLRAARLSSPSSDSGTCERSGKRKTSRLSPRESG